MTPAIMNRLSYAHWPRWVKIVWCCTMPVGLGLMMLGTMTGIPMIYLWWRSS